MSFSAVQGLDPCVEVDAHDSGTMGVVDTARGRSSNFALIVASTGLARAVLSSPCMSHAKHALWAGATALLLAGVAACSLASADSMSLGDERPAGTDGRNDGGANAGESPSSSLATPSATGVVLVHAASFPSFRLCFSNFPDLVPQPDARVMPEANVVGVDIGSVVRIDPLEAPGTVYVIRESEIRLPPGTTNAPKCGQLIRKPGEEPAGLLDVNIDYYVASTIDQPLGKNAVSVLAITGCSGEALLDSLGASSVNCGPTWNVKTGNLEAKTFELVTSGAGATDKKLPVQLFHMSPALQAFTGPSGSLDVTFGQLDADAGPLAQPLSDGPLFQGGSHESLALDQSAPSVYASFGFRITATSGASTFSTDQSLAAVQELSAPRELPTTYYRAASSYALLLLGDPAYTAKLENGDPRPKFNPRQAVHILAVPVLDPEKADGGTDAGSSSQDGGS